MYSHDIFNYVNCKNYELSIEELNKLMSDSEQAHYEIIQDEKEKVKIKFCFNDRGSFEAWIWR